MKTLMGLGLLGWIVALVVGFGLGGVFFLSIRLQVDYVLNEKGKEWIVPACLYARMALVGVVLVLVAVTLPGEKVAGVMMAGTIGAILARLLISRMVKNSLPGKDVKGNDS
jgi:uncharacterized Tic20 family protein